MTQEIGGHIVRGQWRPVQNQSSPKRNPVNGKAYWGGAAIGFGSQIAAHWDTIRPIAAGAVGAVGGMMACGPGLAARAGGYAALAVI